MEAGPDVGRPLGPGGSHQTMIGAFLPGNSTVELKEVAVPTPGHGEVLLRMKASTICGSDIRCIYHEHLGKGPEGYQGVVAGHEPCGRIEQAGPGCRLYGVGDRVIVYHISGCGICNDCRRGYMISCTSEKYRRAYGWQRDGVVLRADVHRPGSGGTYPVLVWRTPYGKHKQHFEQYVKGGYIVVCQDVRGRYASDGTWESWLRPHSHDAEDGYDTVQWAARLPGASGKVGTIGLSYTSFLQWRLAPLRPPALAAMSAHSIAARYTDLEGPGTIRPGRRLRWSIVTMMPEVRRRANRPGTHTEAEAAALWDGGQGQKWLQFLPWRDLPQEVFEDDTPYMRDWLEHPQTDPWMLDVGCREITVPNLEVVGWYDHAKGDMLLYQTLVKQGATRAARKGSRLVVGPWSHFPPGGRKFGNIDFGPAADLDLVAQDVRWFDYWLKGMTNGVDRDAPVSIFVMGDNGWRDEASWPLKRARSKALYLSGNGKANTPAGDGRLAWERPTADASDGYSYDPRDPVPTLFAPGNFTCATDQRPLSNRVDILVYQTEPLP